MNSIVREITRKQTEFERQVIQTHKEIIKIKNTAYNRTHITMSMKDKQVNGIGVEEEE